MPPPAPEPTIHTSYVVGVCLICIVASLFLATSGRKLGGLPSGGRTSGPNHTIGIVAKAGRRRPKLRGDQSAIARIAHALEPRRELAVVVQQGRLPAASHPQRPHRVPAGRRERHEDALWRPRADAEPPQGGRVILVLQQSRRWEADERGGGPGACRAMVFKGVICRRPEHTDGRQTGYRPSELKT